MMSSTLSFVQFYFGYLIFISLINVSLSRPFENEPNHDILGPEKENETTKFLILKELIAQVCWGTLLGGVLGLVGLRSFPSERRSGPE